MTNSTRMIGLIMTVALWAGMAEAQSRAPSEDQPLGDLALPLPDEERLPVPVEEDQSLLRQSHPSYDFDLHAGEEIAPDLHHMWQGPAPIESTGTWLRRGFWYAEADAVVWNRMWNRDDKIFAAQDPDVQNPLFFFNYVQLLNTNRLMILNGSNPGQDASVRFTLGHFLFRDSENRDHRTEFTVLGGGEWEQNRIMSSENPFGLFVPFMIDGGNRSFDQSSFQSIDYSSNYKSFEWNYEVTSRLRRDQMIMDANGHWHRAANPGFVRQYLAGLRFMELRERLDWRAEDIVQQGNDGSYLIRTDNDMFGFQLGAGLEYQASRWSLGAHPKGGVFVNDALGRTTLNFTADDNNDADLRLRENELSFIGEFKLQGRFNITPGFSIRAAYEMMYIESVALAPSQATFITDISYLNTTGDPFYHGASFGFEGYW